MKQTTGDHCDMNHSKANTTLKNKVLKKEFKVEEPHKRVHRSLGESEKEIHHLV